MTFCLYLMKQKCAFFPLLKMQSKRVQKSVSRQKVTRRLILTLFETKFFTTVQSTLCLLLQMFGYLFMLKLCTFFTTPLQTCFVKKKVSCYKIFTLISRHLAGKILISRFWNWQIRSLVTNSIFLSKNSFHSRKDTKYFISQLFTFAADISYRICRYIFSTTLKLFRSV